jgi:hypothetical protein
MLNILLASYLLHQASIHLIHLLSPILFILSYLIKSLLPSLRPPSMLYQLNSIVSYQTFILLSPSISQIPQPVILFVIIYQIFELIYPVVPLYLKLILPR